MPKCLPKTIGVTRQPKTARMHSEVLKNLQDIADRENKSFSYVVSEIVYSFFGLKVSDDIVEVRRARREASTRKGRRDTHRRYVERVLTSKLLSFEARRNASRIA